MQKYNLDDVKRIFTEDHDEDQSLKNYLDDLLALDYIEDERAIGITKKITNQVPANLNDLSPSQVYVFRDYVMKPYYVESCKFCSMPIPWTEMISALEDGYCAHCRHILEKDE
ncbi:hypothetical protein [Alkalibacillus salilacus]|uniref:DksA C4-type domain-containing protein n=1 Tax=Alkalibacillus salilacus TaxID=284582 RepID=A0ABT9VDC5_9BACI|nr:hypothetical protein [Alkalibacillus salilacus]MDQ0158976.1 hypothetical protein [Alkalibacillus salilacus]